MICSTICPTGRWLICCIAICLFSPAHTWAIQGEPETNNDLAAWARETVQRRMKQNNVPSVSFGIVRAGEVLLVDGYGTREIGSEDRVDENSLFQIASQSKMLTGIIANELLKEGLLDLETPIAKWLGPISENAKKELSNVTLQHLMHHRSGIPNYACSVYGKSKQEGRLYWTQGYSEQELLGDINRIRLEFEPGTKFGYSNSGFALVGYISQKVSGLSYEELLEKYVTRKYGLSATCIVPTERQKTALAIPYYPHARTTASKPSDWGMVTASSGVFSSAKDLTNLMIAQLEAYRTDSASDVSPLVLTRLVDSTRATKMKYGFGIFKNQMQGYANYLHGGNADGYSCAYVFSPEKNVGLVLLSSSGGHWFGQLEEELYHKLTGEEYTYSPERKSLAQAVFDVAAQEGVQAGIKFFQKSKDSEEFYVRESELQSVGNAMLNGGHLEDATEIFKLVVSEFPDSWTAHESLGEAYVKQEKVELAIESYERSLKLNPKNEACMKVLGELTRRRLTSPNNEAGNDHSAWSPEQKAIIKQGQRFSAAAIAEDTETQISIYSEDAVIAPPGRSFISDTDGIRQYWLPADGRDMLTHRSTPKNIVVEGKFAYDWGTYEGTSKNANGQVNQFKGKYLIIWRKDASGNWRMVHDMWH